MKKITGAVVLFCISIITACNNGDDNSKKLPAPGTVIATDKMAVTGDTLNHFELSVKVVADSDIQAGVYDVDVAYGPNKATGKFMMPKGGEHLRPVLRRGAGPNSFVVGFMIKGDTTFYDYYEVKCDRQAIRMDYLKSYTF
jgi:hypothetical protein